jgi:hypothetical protein
MVIDQDPGLNTATTADITPGNASPTRASLSMFRRLCAPASRFTQAELGIMCLSKPDDMASLFQCLSAVC